MTTAELDLPLLHAGKVRKLYALPDPSQILVVATDAISAFDHVLTPEIPGKGRILTQMSLWWFEQLADIVPNHVISLDVPEQVAGRAMVCEKLDMVMVECIARGYITGSGFKAYKKTGQIAGIALPEGLQDGDRLAEPIFTPSTKAAEGQHDELIDADQLAALVDKDTADELRELTLAIYRRAGDITRERGIILADTKFEFGRRPDGSLVLADEVLTPDSSRFWIADSWDTQHGMESVDKQYVRNWLLYKSGWDPSTDTEPPALPQSVVDATIERYLEAYRRLTGNDFQL